MKYSFFFWVGKELGDGALSCGLFFGPLVTYVLNFLISGRSGKNLFYSSSVSSVNNLCFIFVSLQATRTARRVINRAKKSSETRPEVSPKNFFM